jgi:hypothetical protein
MTKQEYIQSIPQERFQQMATDLARADLERLFSTPGVMEAVLEEFNNEVIEFLEQEWESDNPEQGEEEKEDRT